MYYIFLPYQAFHKFVFKLFLLFNIYFAWRYIGSSPILSNNFRFILPKKLFQWKFFLSYFSIWYFSMYFCCTSNQTISCFFFYSFYNKCNLSNEKLNVFIYYASKIVFNGNPIKWAVFKLASYFFRFYFIICTELYLEIYF